MENIQIEAQRRNNMEYRKRLKILKSIRQDEKILHRYHWRLIKILENGKNIGKYNSEEFVELIKDIKPQIQKASCTPRRRQSKLH